MLLPMLSLGPRCTCKLLACCSPSVGRIASLSQALQPLPATTTVKHDNEYPPTPCTLARPCARPFPLSQLKMKRCREHGCLRHTTRFHTNPVLLRPGTHCTRRGDTGVQSAHQVKQVASPLTSHRVRWAFRACILHNRDKNKNMVKMWMKLARA